MGSRIRVILFVVFAGIHLIGCRQKIVPGHYEGNLLKKESTGYSIEPVQIEVTKSKDPKVQLEIKNQNNQLLVSASVAFNYPKKNEINIELTGLLNGNYHLIRTPVTNQLENYKCYSGFQIQTIYLCFSKNQFHLEVLDQALQQIFTLYGNKFKKEMPFKLEEPQEISISQAIDEALKNNFESRIALQHVLQAKHSATAAWLNLLPHLTSNLIWLAPMPNYISIIATVQGLLPFLLPVWWMDAKIADINKKIQKDALLIMQADLASNIEQLFYSFERDSRIKKAHEKIMTILVEFNSILQQQDGQSFYDARTQTLLNINNELIDFIRSGQEGIERVLKEDRYAISLALGKHNPDAISNISLDEELQPYERSNELDQNELSRLAIQRSIELSQIDYLIQSAQIKEIESYFNWIDPSSDSRSSFGLNLIGQIKVSKAQIDELKIKREQLKSIIYKNTFLLVLDYNACLNSMKKNSDAQTVEKNFEENLRQLRINFSNALTGDKIENDYFKTKVKSSLAEIVDFEIRLASFRVARAKKDRLLISGYFEKLLPQLPCLQLPMGFPTRACQPKKSENFVELDVPDEEGLFHKIPETPLDQFSRSPFFGSDSR